MRQHFRIPIVHICPATKSVQIISRRYAFPLPHKTIAGENSRRYSGASRVGVYLFEWHKLVCGAMLVILPASLMAQDSARAMLHNDGGVLLNGGPAPKSSAIFLHDLVQTQKGNWAKIDADGSAVTVQPETIVRFEGDELVLEHGGLQLNTSRGLKVRVNCITVIPLTQDWNRYDVTDVDGRVTVVAHQNDDKIHYQGSTTRLSKQADRKSTRLNSSH